MGRATFTTYTTRMELEYLKTIGKHCEAFSRMTPFERNQRRIKQLNGYIAGSEKRVNWCDLDKEKVMEFTHAKLDKLLGIKKVNVAAIGKEIKTVMAELVEV
jgi:hypothetical protein